MKTTSSFLLVAALSPAAFLLSSCSKTGAQQAADDAKVAATNLAADVTTAASDSWDTIKDYTYEKRADFADRLDRMAEKRDADIQKMNGKLEGLPDAAAKERDRAVKEFNESRSYLKSRVADLRTGTAATWADGKQKVADAWQRMQASYDKAKASPSS